jgi:hypothetical protein
MLLEAIQVCLLNSLSPSIESNLSFGYRLVWPFVFAGDKKPQKNSTEPLRAPNIFAARLLPSAWCPEWRKQQRANHEIRFSVTPLMFAAWVAQDRKKMRGDCFWRHFYGSSKQ